MKKALLLIDLQLDFCKNGALAVPDGNAVIPVANRLTVEGKWDNITASIDWHSPTHKSFASNNPGKKVGDIIKLNGLDQFLWPDHCVVGSKGAELHPNLITGKIALMLRKGMNPEIDSYSAFNSNGHREQTGLCGYLKELNIGEVYILGLALDYCCKYTALDAVALGFKTHLILDGVRAVNINPTDGDKAVAEMKEKGVVVVKSDNLLGVKK